MVDVIKLRLQNITSNLAIDLIIHSTYIITNGAERCRVVRLRTYGIELK